jgi:hypothetical protein
MSDSVARTVATRPYGFATVLELETSSIFLKDIPLNKLCPSPRPSFVKILENIGNSENENSLILVISGIRKRKPDLTDVLRRVCSPWPLNKKT